MLSNCTGFQVFFSDCHQIVTFVVLVLRDKMDKLFVHRFLLISIVYVVITRADYGIFSHKNKAVNNVQVVINGEHVIIERCPHEVSLFRHFLSRSQQ